MVDDHGLTLRQRWLDAEALGMATAEEWRPAPLPFQLYYIWNWFLEMHQSRHFDIKGRARSITYRDMIDWSLATERKLTLFEIGIIRQLDQRYFYVLSTPNGVAGQFMDDGKQAEANVAAALRSMARRSKKEDGGPGLTALPEIKTIPVAPPRK